MTRNARGLAARALIALGCCTSAARAADSAVEIFELPKVDVVGTAPLPGFGTPLRDVPANVQIFDQRLFARPRPLALTQFLEGNAASAGAASGQGNPYQQSLDFRGFSASPLLGTPQGMSVFQDGVRINEPFGDVVNWDLLPRSAISSVQLVPGSVPAFGLNTLGGALALYTRSGAQYPGSAAELSGGSFGRRTLEAEYGHANANADFFATANLADEDGWAMHNASRVRQFFGKAGFRTDVSDLDVSVTLADNTLNGSQTLPVSFIDRPREPYTYPDVNDNRVVFVVAKASRLLGDEQLVDANLYYRRYRNTNFSSNVNDDFGDDDDNPAANDRSTTDTGSYGGALQWTYRMKHDGVSHQVALGASANGSQTTFTQATQPATFTDDRGTFATGPFTPTTDADLRTADGGVYASDTINVAAAWTLALAARYNVARVEIRDRSGQDPGLDGTHTFSRVNPAFGLTFHPGEEWTAYASYNEGMRAPTPMELTCADPDAPCKLPNQFLADPPLAKIVSATIETGARGRFQSGDWAAAVYRTELRDDIAFIASGSGATNAGYFTNVGRTRRQGVELSATVRADPMTVALRYSATDARFRSPFTAVSPSNSHADAAGAIAVQRGDRMPGIPIHGAKLRIDWEALPALTIGASVVAASSQYARGDENNADAGGRVPGYAVVHVDAEYRLTRTVTLFAQVDNLFDRRYANFGLLGANVFTGPDRTFGPAQGIAAANEQFRALGAPRGIWAGVRVSLGDSPGAARL